MINKGEWEPNHYNVLKTTRSGEPFRWDPDNEMPSEDD